MGAFHVIGINFKFRLREDFRALLEQKRLMLHVGIGVLAHMARHEEFPLKHTSSAAHHRALGHLPGLAGRRAMPDMAGKINMLSRGTQIGTVQRRRAARLLMGQPGLDPRHTRAERQGRLDQPGPAIKVHHSGDRLGLSVVAALEQCPPDRTAGLNADLDQGR